jgi:hypothetical protein
MKRSTRDPGRGTTMRTLGVLVCALSICVTLTGVANSKKKKPCDPSACVNLTILPNTNTTNIGVLGVVCLDPKDKKGLKAARKECDSAAKACCLDGDLHRCPDVHYTIPGLCSSLACLNNTVLWYCEGEPG